ncbi:MAG: YceI family protein [Verrucomicrobia bacterium]|nr:YceI family protein [Verrucomicrobiota bacterium]
MKSFNLTSATALCAVFILTGCSDPADKVHKSSTADPKSADAGSASTVASREYVIRAESTIGFVGSKVTGSHDGGFKKFAGTLNVADGKIVGTPEVKIAMNSTWSDNEKLTAHLNSPDFFDAAKFPITTFSVTSIAPTDGKHQVTGNLNLHGVSKSISFPAEIQITDEKVSLNAEFAINRKDFDINYPGRPNDLIRDNVVLKLGIQATPGAPRPEDQLTN